MTIRLQQILGVLVAWGHHGGISASTIAAELNCPEPSVRRSIQELIRLGHNISWASRDGRYGYRADYGETC